MGKSLDVCGPVRPGLLLAALLGAALACTGCALASSPGAAPARAGPHFLDPAASVQRVLELEQERLALMPAVAAWKWRHRAPVYDPARESAVSEAAERLGAPLGLSGAPLARLFGLQVRLARTEETALERRWHARGYDFRGRVGSLTTQIRPRLDRLTRELLAAIYLAAPALARPRFASRYAPAAARILSGDGWSAASRRALLEALGRIRLRAVPALERIDAARVLRIGTTGDYAPFSADVRGRLQGVDIELARDLARRLGARPVFVRTTWPTLLEDLRRDAFDVALGGISATRTRAAAAALSVPYLASGKTLIARCRDAGRFGSLADVDRPGVRVIVDPGGTNERYVRTHLHRARILVHRGNESLFGALVAGRADVMITDDVEVAWQTRRHPQLCRTLPGTLTRSEKVILMTRDPALEVAVNAWLRGEIAAGVPSGLLKKALSP